MGNMLKATPDSKCNLREAVTVTGARPLVRSETWFIFYTRSLRYGLGREGQGSSKGDTARNRSHQAC